MTEQALTLIPVDRLDRMEALLRDLAARVEASTITPAPVWLTAAQAGRKAGVSRSTIYRWAESGQIEAKGAGKARKFRL